MKNRKVLKNVKNFKKLLPLTIVLLVFSTLVSYAQISKVSEPKTKTFEIKRLSNYQIIYDGDDIFSEHAANILKKQLKNDIGIELAVYSDEQSASKYELLIGETNREESEEAEKVRLESDEFLLALRGDKVVMHAEDYMVGGAANEFAQLCKGGKALGSIKLYTEWYAEEYEFESPENVILMIGDGMGFNHITAARTENYIPAFYAEAMPNKGQTVTYSKSVELGQAKVTDSAAAATAFSTGHKTINTYVGVDMNGNPLKNIRELAHEQGAKTAVLTTDALNGATPSGFLVHVPGRTNTTEIDAQINALIENNQVTEAKGSLGDNLLSQTVSTLDTISADDSNFFIMIEEGYIDKNSHSNLYKPMLETVRRYNDTIAYVMEFTLMNPKTVLIVTADHECGGLTNSSIGYVFASMDHSNVDVPLYAMGMGTEALTETPCDNTQIAKFMAEIFGDSNFNG